MMPFAQFEQCAARIPYQYRHPRMLYALIQWLRPRSVVEVGTHLGMSAVWMARALQENGDGGMLTCIDNFCWTEHRQREQWHGNINACNVGSAVRLVVGRSEDVPWPERVDMAYIDGNHTYAVCQHDVDKALSLGASCIVLNDTVTCAGVRQFGEDFRCGGAGGWDFLEVNFDAGLLVAVKRVPKPACQQGDYDPWDKG